MDEPRLFGRKRNAPDPKKIAARVFPVVEHREGVQPLNPGFFRVEAARNEKAAKRRDVKVKRVRG